MNKEDIKGYRWVCPNCNKEIISINLVQQSFNIGVHKRWCSESAEKIVKEIIEEGNK